MALALFKKKPKKGEEAAPDEAEDAKTAPEGEEGEGEAEAKKGGPPLKLILIGAAAGLVLVGGGGGAFLMLSHPSGKATAHKAATSRKKDGKDAKVKEGDRNGPQIADGPDGVVFYTLPDIVVNMQSADGKPTYLKLKLTLELPSQDTVDVIEPNRPRLEDMFQTFLRELRPEDLAGSQGSYQLRMEILRRVNLVIAPAKINSVLIEEMLIN
jgi:flagellar FliL protein